VISDVEPLRLPFPTLAPFTLAGGDAARRAERAEPLRAAFLQFSSGTTGIKRGVPIGADTAFAQLDVYASALGLSAGDVILSWLPLYHDMGFVACLNMPLAHGVHTVMLDPIRWVTNPATFLRAASDYRATLAWNPNFAYAFMAQRVRERDLDGVRIDSLRGLANCSEPVTHESQQQFLERFAPVGAREDMFWGCYAMAETTFALTHGTPSDPGYLDEQGPSESGSLRGRVQVSVGRALPGVELRVVAEDGEDLPDRRIGELWVRSPFNFEGYHRDDEATAASHADGWYRTGDLGYRAGAAFYVVGRKKDLIIVGGVNVFPQDVEELVAGIDGVTPGRVSAFSDFDPALQTERVVVLFESELDAEAADALVLHARQLILASFQIANFGVHRVEPGWLVKSSSGKMARSANRAKWAERSAVPAG
jgi:fatty-acyl-CoA synthase